MEPRSFTWVPGTRIATVSSAGTAHLCSHLLQPEGAFQKQLRSWFFSIDIFVTVNARAKSNKEVIFPNGK